MKVYKFFGKNHIFSNFYPITYVYDNQEYNCGEQGFMHQKALFFKDFEIADEIINTKYDDPVIYKKLGRKVSNFNEKEWSYVRFDIMVDLIYARCLYNTDYKKLLLSLKDFIIAEASPRDLVWGIGYGKDNPKGDDPKTWRGRNLLGYAYMKVRDTKF